jgi:hypothetical protein
MLAELTALWRHQRRRGDPLSRVYAALDASGEMRCWSVERLFLSRWVATADDPSLYTIVEMRPG